jgi:ABC-type transport system substrate-binding protein
MMIREHLLPPKALRWALWLIVLMLAAAYALEAAPAAGQAKVDRLVMGLILPYRDYWRPWIVATPDHNIQHDPALEWLFEVDPETGQYKPWLAESWKMAPDGRSWAIKLQKGVQFHHGYGEFTAQDVVHNHALWCDPNYPGRKDPASGGYKTGICLVERVEVVNDYEIVMRCKVVCADLDFYYSSASNVMIFSKKQWDAEGEMAYEKRPAGGHRALYV